MVTKVNNPKNKNKAQLIENIKNQFLNNYELFN